MAVSHFVVGSWYKIDDNYSLYKWWPLVQEAMRGATLKCISIDSDGGGRFELPEGTAKQFWYQEVTFVKGPFAETSQATLVVGPKKPDARS